jgi:hypothetical protein
VSEESAAQSGHVNALAGFRGVSNHVVAGAFDGKGASQEIAQVCAGAECTIEGKRVAVFRGNSKGPQLDLACGS